MTDDPFDPITDPVTPGTLDVRVFDQTQVWVDVAGHVHDLATMNLPYLVNVAMHVRVFASRFYATHFVATIGDQHELDRQMGSDSLEDLADRWVQNTPLYRQLLLLIDQADDQPTAPEAEGPAPMSTR